MFHKEHSTTLFNGKKFKDTPIRKSDRKNLRNRVATSLKRLNESEGQEITPLLDTVFMQGSLVSRSVVLPNDKATLYYRSNVDANDSIWPYTGMQCVWIEANGWHVPSVAFLSTLPPNALPTVVVPSAVSKFLCRGAHLMRAGVIRIAPEVDCGSHTVGVCVSGNPQPFAVGILTFTADFWTNRKGIAVSVISAYGDDLWKQQRPTGTCPGGALLSPIGGAAYDAGDYGNVGFLQGKLVSPIVDAQDDSEGEDMGDSEMENAEGSEGDLFEPIVENAVATATDDTCNTAAAVSSDEGPEASGPSTQPENEDAETPELRPSPDDILHRAVCRALVKLKNSVLPMTVATFYAQHVLPNRDPGSTIELKQTKWKKFFVYLKEQVDRGLVTVAADAVKKDPMAKLTGFDRRHDDLRLFMAEKKGTPVNDMDTALKKLVLVDLYCVPHHFQSMLRLDADAVAAANATSEERKGTGKLTLKETRQILEGYISRELLVKPTNPNTVVLDGPLTDALYKNKNGFENPPESLSRKELADAWLAKMDPAYALVEMPHNRILRMSRGKPPTVVLEVSRRQSNKFVTRVRGLEHYGIDPASFSKEVATRFACAASVEDETPKSKDVFVQGNLGEEVEALLLGDESLTSHGGARDSPFRLPKNAITVELRKGVPARKKKK